MDFPMHLKRKLWALEIAGFASLFLAFLGHNHFVDDVSERAGIVFIAVALPAIGILWRVGRHFLIRNG